ncbi:unnamed protein product [Urochloa decumbens]|uniref:Uncharacterized protein n=1 Tax=Urochloa decumbens TaxID=240449 RepID=A0ABC9H212_9POAL
MALLLPLPEVEETDEDGALLLELEERRRRPPQIKMKLAPYAMYCVFNGAGPRGQALGAAYTGLHFVLYFVRFLAVSPVPEVAAFWGPIHTAVQCLCYATTAVVMCAFIRWYMAVDGVYHVEFDPQMLEPPAAATVVEVPALLSLLACSRYVPLPTLPCL